MEVQHNGGWYVDGQAGDTKRGVSCLNSWLGISHGAEPAAAAQTAQMTAQQWDIVHINFGLHDLNNHGKEVSVSEYASNLKSIVDRCECNPYRSIDPTPTRSVDAASLRSTYI